MAQAEPTPATATSGTAPRSGTALSRFRQIASRFIIPATTKCNGLRLAFDIEANGLLHDATTVHCVIVSDLDSDRVDQYGPHRISAALAHLSRATYLIGHNICGFDLPLLQHLHNWTPAASCTIVDTLIAARLILPNLDDLDDKAAGIGGPKMGKLRGRYSIEAWGARLHIAKVGADIIDWSTWTPEMQERCAADVAICKALWQFLQPDGYSAKALELEHRVARICERITADGVPFDVNAAAQLCQQWTVRRAELGRQLSRQFPGTNLNSRKQIGTLLEARGWVAQKRTEKTGQPQIDDELLEAIPTLYPEFAGLAEYSILGRRLAALTKGDSAWCKHVDNDGRVHGGLVHIGTPHSRAKHLTPNLAQVPNPKRGKPFATECRSLFRTSNDWVFVCCDQAGLQDRAFAHYLAEFDAGAYAKAFLNGLDPHWKTATDLDLIAKDTGLDKKNKAHVAIRENSKSFRYAFLFGAGSPRAGHIINNAVRAVHHIDAGNDLQKKLFGDATRPNEAALKRVGKQALDKFIAGTPGLARLRMKLKNHAGRFGWLPGLDGRRVPVSAQYKALNFQLTSAEAVLTKRWLVNVFDELNQKFRYGWDGDCVITLWVHDEIAVCCRPEIAAQIGEIMVRHAKEPAEFYKFDVPLDADFKVGRSWAGELPSATAKAGAVSDELAVHERTGRNSDARYGLGDSRRKIDSCVSDGDEPHHQMLREDSARLAVASEVSSALENGIDTAQDSNLGSAGNGKIICPFHNDHDPSLHLYADGHYHCYVCGAHGSIEELPEAPSASPPKAAQSETDTLRRGIQLWQAAVSIRGTLAEQYLRETRKLDLATLPNIDAVLRFHPRSPFDGSNHPCLIALFRDVETDEIAGIHRIALSASAEKIGRMMLGSWPRPRAIKLRASNDQLMAGEGIDTVIAGAMRLANTSSTLWAMGSANAIGKLPLIAGFVGLTVLVDREASNIGLENARACTERWRRAGRKTGLAIPHQAEADFNDLIKEKSS
jgi:DNA polymerase I-like protein with 3'-5' exonuclease and polymerase domains